MEVMGRLSREFNSSEKHQYQRIARDGFTLLALHQQPQAKDLPVGLEEHVRLSQVFKDLLDGTKQNVQSF